MSSTVICLVQPLKEVIKSQKPHMCTPRTCYVKPPEVLCNVSVKPALNTTFSPPTHPPNWYQSSIIDMSHFFPLLWLLSEVIMQESPTHSFHICPLQLTLSPTTKIQGLPSESQGERASFATAVASCPGKHGTAWD